MFWIFDAKGLRSYGTLKTLLYTLAAVVSFLNDWLYDFDVQELVTHLHSVYKSRLDNAPDEWSQKAGQMTKGLLYSELKAQVYSVHIIHICKVAINCSEIVLNN